MSRSLFSKGSLTLLVASLLATVPIQAKDLFYTTSPFFSNSTGAELFGIEVHDHKITTRDIGPTRGGNCASLALSPTGTLYSMCGPLFGDQQLATIDTKTGLATLFGVANGGVEEGGAPIHLAVMAMAFGPDGVLYAVGDCNPNSSFECTPGDEQYNSLYKVNLATGAFTRVGSTGAAQFFMDLAFDCDANLFGVTTTVSPSTVPAILYRIDPTTGAAAKLVTLVGSNSVMGLAFSREGKLYATDFTQDPGLYLIDIDTGFEKAIFALPFGFSSSLELANPEEEQDDRD